MTYEERLQAIAEKAENRLSMMNEVSKLADDAAAEDNALISTNRQPAGYGTWKVTLFVNEYAFGERLAAKLREKYIITHDEEHVDSVADFRERIEDVMQEMILEWW